MGIGFRELLIILAIALLIFGAKRLRTIGSDLGAAVKGFKKAVDEGETEESSKQLKAPAAPDADFESTPGIQVQQQVSQRLICALTGCHVRGRLYRDHPDPGSGTARARPGEAAQACCPDRSMDRASQVHGAPAEGPARPGSQFPGAAHGAWQRGNRPPSLNRPAHRRSGLPPNRLLRRLNRPLRLRRISPPRLPAATTADPALKSSNE